MEFSRLKPLVLLLGWPYCYSCENAKNLLEALWDPAVKFTCFCFNFFSFFNFLLAIIILLRAYILLKLKNAKLCLNTIINMLPLWFVQTIEETENPSVRVGRGGCGLIVFCSWMIPCFYYDPLC